MPKPKFKGGVPSVLEILANLDPEAQKKLLANIAKKDETLARTLEQGLFGFEDLISLSARDTQELLRTVPGALLLLALRKASDGLKEHLYANMSKRQAESLKEELAAQPAKRLSEVQAAQSEIIAIARRLEGEGKLLLQKK